VFWSIVADLKKKKRFKRRGRQGKNKTKAQENKRRSFTKFYRQKSRVCANYHTNQKGTEKEKLLKEGAQ